MTKNFPAALLAAGFGVLLGSPALWANSGCATCPAKHPCPPPHCHYSEGPPNLKFKKACPRPVCDPCNFEQYGYHPTCWQPWAFPPNYGHCPVPHTGTVLPPPAYPPYAPRFVQPAPMGGPERREKPARDLELDPPPRKPGETLPPPRKFDDKPSVRLLDPAR